VTEFTLCVGDGGDDINSDQADWAEAVVALDDGRTVRVGDLPVIADEGEEISTEPPFSLRYDGRPFAQIAAGWPVQRRSRSLDARRTELTSIWADPQRGVEVRCVAVVYADFPTVEWTLYLRNTGSGDSPMIEAIRPVDTRFEGTPQGDIVLRHHTGDMCTPDSYAPHAEPLPSGSRKRIANTGGRPTQHGFPYFHLVWPGRGLIAVISWAGQWAMEFEADRQGTVGLVGGQETTHFRLHPGEEVRTPLIVFQFYDGDWLRGQNIWRQWMVEHNLPRPGGRLVEPMASLCTGNYYPGLMSNAAQELRFIQAHLDKGLRFDGWWQDAGWYPCDGVTWPKTGTWEVDRTRFPRGLREVSDFVHARGIKSIVWFEPERVHAGTMLADEHPEWVHGGKAGGLLKLGDPACRAWLTDHIDRILTAEAIDVYRQDFNIDPLAYWQGADTPDRQGITEIRHVEGYFAYWDELRRRHPGLLIDSCASGGRRNDLETLRRAVPLLRSDWYNAPDGQQCHTWALSLWMPYQGTAGYLYRMMNDRYWIRSQMTAEWTFGPEASGLDGVDWSLLKWGLDEWGQVKGCLFGDFYPLTPYALGADVWMAWQYDCPADGKGVVQVFRRGQSIYESARLPLRGLNPAAAYEVTDLDTRRATTFAGQDLLKDGLPVSLPGRPGAATIVYRRLPGD
jgi:alpha-galactosidase